MMKIIVINIFLGLLGGFSMIYCDYFLRDKIFGINILVWPLSFIITIIIAQIFALKTKSFKSTFIKSGLYNSITAFILTLTISLYMGIQDEQISLTNFLLFFIIFFPSGIATALIIALFFNLKSLPK